MVYSGVFPNIGNVSTGFFQSLPFPFGSFLSVNTESTFATAQVETQARIINAGLRIFDVSLRRRAHCA
jgi:hypothetical protein